MTFIRLRTFFCTILSIVVIAIFPLNCFAVTQNNSLALSAKGAVLIDLDERNILYQKNATERMPMASTTKIVTALLVCELSNIDAIVKIPREAVGVEGSSIYLCEGELLSVEELLYALLLESANDAAVALAVFSAGSIEEFAKKCNEKARELGLENTSFVNPHGLYNENHYTTAYDLAILTAEALKNPTISKICATKHAQIRFGVTDDNPSGEGMRYLKNHNKLLTSYDGAIGVKTGFTKKSGRCLISAAKRGELTLIAVTLNAPDDWRDHTALLDFGFENYERKLIFAQGEFNHAFPLSNGENEFITVTNLSPIYAFAKKGELKYTTKIEACFRFAIAPISEGQIMGKLCVNLGTKAYTSTLVSTENAEIKQKAHRFFD